MDNAISFDELRDILRNDSEFAQLLKTKEPDKVELYKRYLPEFEAFLFSLPDDLTIPILESLLKLKPVEFRYLYAIRFSEFIERIQAGYKLPTYKNLKDILLTELYVNHHDKVHYCQSK